MSDDDARREASAREAARPAAAAPRGAWEVFLVFLRLGLTSFGGPVAHLGYFREEIVNRRGWLTDAAYADLVALCQFMPGPASSQVGLGVGLARAGGWGMLAAWSGFTLPSAIALILFAYGVDALGGAAGAGWLAGLKAAAVAVVALAVWGMAKSLAPDRPRAAIAILAAAAMLLAPAAFGGLSGAVIFAQVGVILIGAGVGLALFRAPAAAQAPAAPGSDGFHAPVSRGLALLCLAALAALLVGLPLLSAAWPETDGPGAQALAMTDAFVRSGALVFGGGHVVLPLLEAETVGRGWLDAETFVAGYGAAQAVPGPLFTFAAYLGAAAEPGPNGALGGAIALVAIFLPSALLVAGLLPFWLRLRAHPAARAALTGVNAAVVGLLLAALYDPVFILGVKGPATMALALAAGLALGPWRAPPWAVVVAAALLGAGLETAGLLH